MNNIATSIVIATAIFSAVYGITNLHSTRGSGNIVFVVNNITGTVKACNGELCSLPKVEE